MARILLIDPPGFMGNAIGRILGSFGTNKADQAWPPYDLQIFAGYCVKNGHEHRILDANNLKLTFSDIEREVKAYSPDWVIYVTAFPNFILDAKVAESAKNINRYIKTACMTLSIFSVEDPAGKLKQLPALDYIPWGEPEIPLMKLINGEEPLKVKGLFYRDNKGNVHSTGEAEKAKNLDELGIPVHRGLDLKLYRCPVSISKPMTIVNCSRGCINKCSHCLSVLQAPLRYRSIDNVIQELKEIKSLGIKEIKFYDCALTNSKRFTEQLCDAMIAGGYKFNWNCNSRAEMLDEKLINKMKIAGCHTIAIGCESSDSGILKNMGKNETPEEIECAVKMVKKAGLRVLMYLTFGLEGETKETMTATYEFAKRLKPDFVTFGIVVPAPGTDFYNSLAKKGQLVSKDLEWLDPNALPAFSYPHLSRKELHSFTRNAYRNYYFNPGYIYCRIRNIRSMQEIRTGFLNAVSMVTRYFLERTK